MYTAVHCADSGPTDIRCPRYSEQILDPESKTQTLGLRSLRAGKNLGFLQKVFLKVFFRFPCTNKTSHKIDTQKNAHTPFSLSRRFL